MSSQNARTQLLNRMSNHGVTKELLVKSSHFVKQGSHRETVAEHEPRSPGSQSASFHHSLWPLASGFTGEFVV